MKGLFLVLEGGDGCGKSSQIQFLETAFKKNGRTVKTIHFPRLDVEPYGPIIAGFLRGEFGAFEQVHPKLTALLYALDRREAAGILNDLLAAGTVIIADRYLFSNIAYQCAKTDNPEERAALANWIETLEYGEHKIPRPDLTLYLDVPDSFSQANLAAARTGSERDYLQGKKDIHEASQTLQTRVKEEFLRLAQERPGKVVRVDCRAEDGGIAAREEIAKRIAETLDCFVNRTVKGKSYE